jgi:hypothetical protein
MIEQCLTQHEHRYRFNNPPCRYCAALCWRSRSDCSPSQQQLFAVAESVFRPAGQPLEAGTPPSYSQITGRPIRPRYIVLGCRRSLDEQVVDPIQVSIHTACQAYQTDESIVTYSSSEYHGECAVACVLCSWSTMEYVMVFATRQQTSPLFAVEPYSTF